MTSHKAVVIKFYNVSPSWNDKWSESFSIFLLVETNGQEKTSKLLFCRKVAENGKLYASFLFPQIKGVVLKI